MYNLGDKVIYSSLGVFEIADIRTEQVMGASAVYFVLCAKDEPSASQIFVPVGSDIEKRAMRPLISKAQALELIEVAKDIAPIEWINENRARANFSKSVIDEGDHRRIISLIKAIDTVQAKRIADGKKPFLQDDHLRTRALKLLCSELAAVLECEMPEVAERIFPKN